MKKAIFKHTPDLEESEKTIVDTWFFDILYRVKKVSSGREGQSVKIFPERIEEFNL